MVTGRPFDRFGARNCAVASYGKKASGPLLEVARRSVVDELTVLFGTGQYGPRSAE